MADRDGFVRLSPKERERLNDVAPTEIKATSIKGVSDEELEFSRHDVLETRIGEVARDIAEAKEELILDTIYSFKPELKGLSVEGLAERCELRVPIGRPDMEEWWLDGEKILTFYPPKIEENVQAEGFYAVKYRATQRIEKHV